MKLPMPWFLLLAAALATAGQDEAERAALLAAPQYVEPAVTASFVEMTPDELRKALKVVSSRNYAWFGFNTPELQLHLPAESNSTYAQIEMAGPRLLSSEGNDVAYQLERGLHDAEIQTDEIRFLTEDGDSPADFARVVGEITLSYPLVVESREIAVGQPDQDVSIDGPYVEVLDGIVAEAPSFSPLEPIRAYDDQGRQLKTAPYSGFRMENERSFRRVAFHGPVARVEVDSVTRSIDVKIRYDVPIADPLPEARSGVAPDDERAVEMHPDGSVEIEVGAPAAAAADVSLGPLPGPGETIPIPNRAALSTEAGSLADALDSLDQVIPQPLAIVQLVVSPPSLVSISLDVGGGVKQWTWREGEVSEPKDVDTQWLQCKEGMPADALTLQRLPALWDDAARRIGGAEQPMQIVIGQYPCGVAYINVPFESRQRVQYEGDGKFVKVE